MVVRQWILTLCLASTMFAGNLHSQETEKKWNKHDWRITSALSFAPGFLTEKTQSIQIHGYLGYIQDRIHIRGDGFYFLGSSGDRPRFDMNHQIYAGAFYHFTDGKFQPYAGFQPGIAIARSSEYSVINSEGEKERKIGINPVGSFAGGFSYFGDKLFFLFVESRYIFGQHKTNANPVYLDELRFSFGLGFFF